MSELENKELRNEIEELRNEIKESRNENEELRNEIKESRNENEDLKYRFERFAEPCAIGQEQLWKIVREDIQDLPVPDGIDLRDLI